MNNQALPFWDKLFSGSAEYNRFAIICISILVVACMGGITVGLGAIESTFQLSLTVGLTMTVLTLILSVQPIKWILNSSVIALALDFIIIFYNLIAA
jgi:hypothetical protein